MVKKFNTAFIVKDPKTYVNAEEAWYEFSGKKEGSILFIIIPKKDPNNTLEIFKEVISPNKWGKIIWYKSHSNYAPSDLKRNIKKSKILQWLWNGREYVCNFLDCIGLDRLAQRYGPVDIVFSGHRNTQEHLAATLNPKVLYIMDSGMGIQKRIRGSGYIDYRPYSRRNPIKYTLHKLSGFKVFDREKTKIFTIYKGYVETKHQIIENEYSYRKMLINKKKTGNKVFFVSSPIYNRQNISINTYIVFIKDIFKQLKIDPEDVVYVPHPVYEGEKEVKLIVDSLGCNVDSREIPIETKITLYGTIPKICVSPYSSALNTLASLSENKFTVVCAWHPEFDCFEDMIKWKNKSLLKKNSNVKVVNLQNTFSIFNFTEGKCNQPKYKNFYEWDAAVNKNPSLKKDRV